LLGASPNRQPGQKSLPKPVAAVCDRRACFGFPRSDGGHRPPLVFAAEKGVLTFDFAGNHDEVQNDLRGHR